MPERKKWKLSPDLAIRTVGLLTIALGVSGLIFAVENSREPWVLFPLGLAALGFSAGLLALLHP